MTREAIQLVFVHGERAVCHAVDPAVPAGELERIVGLYFAPGTVGGGPPTWVADDGPRSLDPEVPIGRQVPAEAWIAFGTATR